MGGSTVDSNMACPDEPPVNEETETTAPEAIRGMNAGRVGHQRGWN